MQFRLRTLLILLAVMPPLLAAGWSAYRDYVRRRDTVIILDYQLQFFGVTPRLIIQEEDELIQGMEPPD